MTFWSLRNVLKFVRRFFQKRRESSEISPNHQINSTHALFLSTLVCRRLSHCMSSTYILQRLQHIRLLPDCFGYIRCNHANNFHSQLFFFRKGVQTNFLFGYRLSLFFFVWVKNRCWNWLDVTGYFNGSWFASFFVNIFNSSKVRISSSLFTRISKWKWFDIRQ